MCRINVRGSLLKGACKWTWLFVKFQIFLARVYGSTWRPLGHKDQSSDLRLFSAAKEGTLPCIRRSTPHESAWRNVTWQRVGGADGWCNRPTTVCYPVSCCVLVRVGPCDFVVFARTRKDAKQQRHGCLVLSSDLPESSVCMISMYVTDHGRVDDRGCIRCRSLLLRARWRLSLLGVTSAVHLSPINNV